MQLSIVMPVYNEGEVIDDTVRQVELAIQIPHELLIIYDMDEDTTVPVVKKLQQKFPQVKLVKNIHGKGALNALKTGLKEAKGETICVMMADLTDDPKVLNKLAAHYLNKFCPELPVSVFTSLLVYPPMTPPILSVFIQKYF